MRSDGGGAASATAVGRGDGELARRRVSGRVCQTGRDKGSRRGRGVGAVEREVLQGFVDGLVQIVLGSRASIFNRERVALVAVAEPSTKQESASVGTPSWDQRRTSRR